MTKKQFATLIPILFLGALLALSNPGYSNDWSTGQQHRRSRPSHSGWSHLRQRPHAG